MIEHNFSDSKCPETVRFSGGQFEFIVETLHRPTGNGLFGAKPIEQKFPVRAQHASHFLHRLYTRSHDLGTPSVKKFACPVRGDVVPEELKIFFEKVTPHSLEVVSQQVGQFCLLHVREILQTLPGMLENAHHRTTDSAKSQQLLRSPFRQRSAV